MVVSGDKVYNNKGEVVEQWEPYFGSGFDLTDGHVPIHHLDDFPLRNSLFIRRQSSEYRSALSDAQVG